MRITVLTYRKNVKDTWDEDVFEQVKVDTRLGETTMKLHEKEITLYGHSMREVRRLTSTGYQDLIPDEQNALLNITLPIAQPQKPKGSG